jgi:hypothetical protein
MTRLISNWTGLNHYQDISVINIDAVERFLPTDIYHIYDVFDVPKYNKLFQDKGVPGYIINDHWAYLEWEHQDRFLTVPGFACHEFTRYKNINYSNDVSTDYCCNIIANKKQINRYLAFKLAQLFNLNFDYTWSVQGGEFDMSVILGELSNLDHSNWLTPDQKTFLLHPIDLPQKWIALNSGTTAVDKSSSRISDCIDTDGATWPWKNGLNYLFSTTAVSLITESVSYQRGAIFTEKTGYSVLGLTFPLWVGGYRQAEYWKKMGFDIFSDVINHDYQYFDTLIERCWWAIALNKNILTDLFLAQAHRNHCKDRLIDNRKKLLGGEMTKNIKKITDQWPYPANVFIQRAYQIVSEY